jgi:hypothetical protein
MAEARDAPMHQAADLSLKGIGAGLGVIVVGIAIAVCVPWAVIALTGTPSSAPNDTTRPAIRPPVQETDPEPDMAAFRREKMRRLESSGVDPATGRVHIPIERAMQMLVDREKGASR